METQLLSCRISAAVFFNVVSLMMMMMMMMLTLTDSVVCLISKISMNVTLVTTPVQQNKCVSISREAIHA